MPRCARSIARMVCRLGQPSACQPVEQLWRNREPGTNAGLALLAQAPSASRGSRDLLVAAGLISGSRSPQSCGVARLGHQAHERLARHVIVGAAGCESQRQRRVTQSPSAASAGAIWRGHSAGAVRVLMAAFLAAARRRPSPSLHGACMRWKRMRRRDRVLRTWPMAARPEDTGASTGKELGRGRPRGFECRVRPSVLRSASTSAR